jgi:hypothetical protein
VTRVMPMLNLPSGGPTAQFFPKASPPVIVPGMPMPEMPPERAEKTSTGKRVACIADTPSWAFDVNERDMVSYLKDEFEFDHLYVDNLVWLPKLKEYDGIFMPYDRWQFDHSMVPYEKTLGSLRCHWFDPDHPALVTDEYVKTVNRYAGYHVVTKVNFDALKARCPKVVYLTNPVNTRRFCGAPKSKSPVVFEWNGNGNHSNVNEKDVKGVNTLIVPAIKETGAPFVFQDFILKRIHYTEMPGFYEKANVAICASLYEGASNSVMEAMASGLALITTVCGNIAEIHDSQMKHFGRSGIMPIERNVPSLVRAIEKLRNDPERVAEMGRLNRQEIAGWWSWDAWAERYSKFLHMAVDR